MRLINAVEYITGWDVWRQEFADERAVNERYGAEDPNRALIWDEGFRPGIEIVILRIEAIGSQVGAIACRWTGVDAIYRGAKHLITSRKNS